MATIEAVRALHAHYGKPGALVRMVHKGHPGASGEMEDARYAVIEKLGPLGKTGLYLWIDVTSQGSVIRFKAIPVAEVGTSMGYTHINLDHLDKSWLLRPVQS